MQTVRYSFDIIISLINFFYVKMFVLNAKFFDILYFTFKLKSQRYAKNKLTEVLRSAKQINDSVVMITFQLAL